MRTRHYSSTEAASARTRSKTRNASTAAIWALDAATTQFLERLLNRDTRVVVYLDGDRRRMKAPTSEDRLAKRRDEWSTLERYADGSQNRDGRPAIYQDRLWRRASLKLA